MADYVVVQPIAREDLTGNGDHLVLKAGYAIAERVLARIERRMADLRDFPYRSQAVDFIEPGYRRLVEGAYAGYFVVEERTVSIDRVLHSRRDVRDGLGR